MIDQKMIEKLERLYDATILRRLPDSERNFFEYGFQRGYNRAINEFLKDLWHPASEEPKLGKRVLVKINGNLSLFNSGFVVEHIRNFDDCYGIESWLYIDDLFPKEGGKQ